MAGELILIVDDEELIRRQAEAALKLNGYRTATARNGEDALVVLEQNPPDLLLTDIRMPDMDGMQLFSRARQSQPDLVGLFMTAHGSIDNVIKSMHLGISGFLLKPFTGGELDRAISDALQRYRTTQEVARQRLLAPLLETRNFLNGEADFTALSHRLVETVAIETKSDYCALFLRNQATDSAENSWKMAASYSGPGAQNFSPRTFPALRLAARALELGRTLSLRRASTDHLPSVESQNIPGAVISVPLIVDGRGLGALLVGRAATDLNFAASERDLFEVVAMQLVTLVETQRLQTALATRDKRLNQLAARFVASQEEDKRQLVERIQGQMLSTLTATRKNVQAYLQKVRPASAGDLLQAEERLHTLINEIKKLTNQLRPASLEEFGLTGALRQYMKDLAESKETKCQLSFRLEGEEAPRLESSIEIALFRATQDALTNACRQGGSEPVSLLVRVLGPHNHPQTLEIHVTDSGPAFNPASLQAGKTGQPEITGSVELLAMQERVRQAGASCQIESSPAEGTHVTITYQIPELELPAPITITR